MSHTWTSEQEEIFAQLQKTSTSLMISAYAGSAKTTTLAKGISLMKPIPTLAVAFGRKTTQELRERLPPWVDVKTANSIGHSAWNSAIGRRCEVDKDKLKELLRPLGLDEDEWWMLRTLVNLARARGLVPKGLQGVSLQEDTSESWKTLSDYSPTEEQISLAREVLKKCIHQSYTGLIDFEDQIYMSACFGGSFKKYPLILLDEAQDLSPTNHRQIYRSASDRIVALGDQFQSIMAFRGSDANSMENLRKLRPEWIDLKLSKTFRCPKAIVRRRRRLIPDFTAAETNLEGQVKILTGMGWRWSDIPKVETIAILCRNNAPLISMKAKLLYCGISCQLIGRDSWRPLISLAKKILPDSGTSESFARAIALWRDEELEKTIGKEAKLELITERAASLLEIINSFPATSLIDIISRIKEIFAEDSSSLMLSTGHSAKGLEFGCVIHLDPWRIPSIFAKTAESIQQEDNILNVIETRTKQFLILVNVDEFLGA